MKGEASGSERFDWQRVHERLARLGETLERQERGLSAEESEQVLERRARALARPPPAAAVHAAEDVVRFRLASDAYALPTRWAHRVVTRASVLEVPGAPAALLGLALVGNEVLPVVSLRPLLGHAQQAEEGPLLLVGATRAELALATDAVDAVEPLALGTLRPPLPGPQAALLLGLAEDGLAVLDGARLLGDGRLTFELADGGDARP